MHILKHNITKTLIKHKVRISYLIFKPINEIVLKYAFLMQCAQVLWVCNKNYRRTE